MRLLAWNIRQGGGSRLARIADALTRHDADIRLVFPIFMAKDPFTFRFFLAARFAFEPTFISMCLS